MLGSSSTSPPQKLRLARSRAALAAPALAEEEARLVSRDAVCSRASPAPRGSFRTGRRPRRGAVARARPRRGKPRGRRCSARNSSAKRGREVAGARPIALAWRRKRDAPALEVDPPCSRLGPALQLHRGTVLRASEAPTRSPMAEEEAAAAEAKASLVAAEAAAENAELGRRDRRASSQNREDEEGSRYPGSRCSPCGPRERARAQSNARARGTESQGGARKAVGSSSSGRRRSCLQFVACPLPPSRGAVEASVNQQR